MYTFTMQPPHPLALSLLLPGLNLISQKTAVVAAAAASIAGPQARKDCHGKMCHAGEEYCSVFSESCEPCSKICDPATHNYQPDACAQDCPEYSKYEPLKAEIQSIQTQQHIIIILLAVLLSLIAIRYCCECLRWLRQKRCFMHALKKLQPKQKLQQPPTSKDINGMVVPNVMAINAMERAPSQIYSLTAGADGSVMTMTTPVSTRYPAENSATPTTIAKEYSYDNQALAITPVSEKPNGGTTF